MYTKQELLLASDKGFIHATETSLGCDLCVSHAEAILELTIQAGGKKKKRAVAAHQVLKGERPIIQGDWLFCFRRHGSHYP